MPQIRPARGRGTPLGIAVLAVGRHPLLICPPILESPPGLGEAGSATVASLISVPWVRGGGSAGRTGARGPDPDRGSGALVVHSPGWSFRERFCCVFILSCSVCTTR